MAKTSGQLEKERIRQRNMVIISDLSVCYHCKTKDLTENDKFCPVCGFPQRGSQNEQQRFVANFKNKNFLLEEQKKSINKARIILFVLGGINLLLAVGIGVFMLVSEVSLIYSPVMIVSQIIVGGIYLCLGFWCKTKPLPAILAGLIVYITFVVLGFILEPESIIRGAIWKVVVISSFVYGYKSVQKAEKFQKELDIIKKARDTNA